MNKTIITVPAGYRYLSEWKGYRLSDYPYPHILNKTVTGCGFTEYCINSEDDIIILSPRKLLLHNKERQNPDKVFYARNSTDEMVDYEKDLSSSNKKIQTTGESSVALTPRNILFKDKLDRDKKKREDELRKRAIKMKRDIQEYWNQCRRSLINPKIGKPCKILVTYDSFRYVKEALGEDIKNFYIVVDEFQSIFVDSKFKSNTEIELLDQLRDLEKVCFASATPMMEDYLDLIEPFCNLPYIELDWKSADPKRIKSPSIIVHECTKYSVEHAANEVIQRYLSGNYPSVPLYDINGNLYRLESEECVLYLNSVNSIARLIKKNKLSFSDVNVLCARTSDNEKKIKKAFGLTSDQVLLIGGSCIGDIPKKGEPHKKFTFCTRTVYLGADFYSKCAKTYVFSDANIDSLSVDISMDLEQILGRQRLDENPWKNSAEVYVKTNFHDISFETFMQYVNDKKLKSNRLLSAYQNLSEEDEKKEIADAYEYIAKSSNYSLSYVAVNNHFGKKKVPVFNELIMLAEIRAFQVQQLDYRDRFSVFSTLEDQGFLPTDNEKIKEYVEKFNSFSQFTDRMKYICEVVYVDLFENRPLFMTFLSHIPEDFGSWFNVFSPDKIRSLRYEKNKLREEFEKELSRSEIKDTLKDLVLNTFTIGKKYPSKEIKNKLQEIYNTSGYTIIAKASDLSKWFKIKPTKISDGGERKNGYEIVDMI